METETGPFAQTLITRLLQRFPWLANLTADHTIPTARLL